MNKGRVPIKIWTEDIEPEALQQLVNVSQLPIVHGHIAAMPDVHVGIGERSPFRADQEVARQCQVESGGDRWPVDGADHRWARIMNCADE